MIYKLSDIIKGTILTEGRLEDVKSKYPEQSHALIDNLSENDPSGNNKYLLWMTKMVIGDGSEEILPSGDYILDLVNRFDASLGKIKKHKKSPDINSYKSVDEVEKVLSNLPRRDKPSRKELKGKGSLVFDNDKLFITSPDHWEGSCELGIPAWCVAMDSTRNYWDSYGKHSLFYYVTSKTMKSSNTNYKVAIQKNIATGVNTYWDTRDKSNTKPWNEDIDSEVLAVVDERWSKDVKNIKERLIKSMIEGVKSVLTSEKLITILSHVTPEELSSILSKGFGMLKNLTPENTNKAINILGDSEMKKLVMRSAETLAGSLSNETLFRWVDENFNSKLKKVIYSRMSEDSINSLSNVMKTKVEKWSLSDEELEKYMSMSQYVFLMDDENVVHSELIKVDRFNPESYTALSRMRLRVRYTPNTSLYGVQTGFEELDKFMDEFKSGEEIPSGIVGKYELQKV